MRTLKTDFSHFIFFPFVNIWRIVGKSKDERERMNVNWCGRKTDDRELLSSLWLEIIQLSGNSQWINNTLSRKQTTVTCSKGR